MKFSDLAILLLVISGVFVIGSLAITDFNNAYPNSNVNQSRLDIYDKTESIQTETNKLKTQWENIQNEDKGWKKFVTGLAAMPNVIIAFHTLVFSTFSIATTVLTQGALDLGIPPAILGILTAMVVVFVVFKLVGWWQRSST